jgi:hypothetical protein
MNDKVSNSQDFSGVKSYVDAASIDNVDDEVVDYREAVHKMPSAVSNFFESYSLEKESSWSTVTHHWCLADMPEGDFPRVYAYSSLKSLVAAIANREGTETAVWPLYGIPLRLTKTIQSSRGKVRYLLLPNNKAVIVREGDDEPELVDQATLDGSIELEEEGWLGDPSYFKEKDYFVEGYVSDDAFSADPDMDDDDDDEVDI